MIHIPLQLQTFIARNALKLLLSILPGRETVLCVIGDNALGLFRRTLVAGRRSKFGILIATVDGDDKRRTHTKAVSRALIGNNSIIAMPVCGAIQLGEGGTRAEEKALRDAKTLLKRHNADLIVFGEVAKHEEAVRLWFATGMSERFQRTIYKLSSNELGKDFDQATQLQIISYAISAIEPATENAGALLKSVLEPITRRIESFVQGDTTLTSLQVARLSGALGTAQAALAYQTADRPLLSNAIDNFQSAIRNPDLDNAEYAALHRRLGMAYAEIADRHMSADCIEPAYREFEAALALEDKSTSLISWARSAKSRLGIMGSLARYRDDKALLARTLSEYDELVVEDLRNAHNEFWEICRADQANALTNLGYATRDAEKIKAAVNTLAEIASKIQRKANPIRWSNIKSNLGSALMNLAELEPEGHWGERGVKEFTEALQAIHSPDLPMIWAGIAGNLGNALSQNSERKDKLEDIETSLDIFENAMNVCPISRSLLVHSLACSAFATAAVRFDTRRIGPGRAHIDEYRENLLRDLQRESDQNWIAASQAVKQAENIDKWIAESIERLRKATTLLKECSKLIDREIYAKVWTQTQLSLGEAQLRLADRTQSFEDYQEAKNLHEMLSKHFANRNELVSLGFVFHNLGSVALNEAALFGRSGAMEEAIRYYEDALDIRSQTGDVIAMNSTKLSLAGALATAENDEKGWLSRAKGLLSEIGEQHIVTSQARDRVLAGIEAKELSIQSKAG